MATMSQDHASASRSDYLVVTRAGKRSVHPQWVGRTGEPMNFDILVAAYEEGVPAVRHEKVFHLHVPGKKVEGYARLLRDHGGFVGSYRSVAFIDDDIATDAATLSCCFAIGSELGLEIWQPALTPDSHFTYAGLLQNPQFAWRYVNFIEMMCPFFSREKLKEVAFLYEQGYESGIDLIWCNLGRRGPRSFAVLDCCPVRHTRPVGGEKEKNGFAGARRYEDDIERILAAFGLPWLSCVPYACVRKSGTIVSSRVGMLVSALPLLADVACCSCTKERVRAVLVHWKHLLTRPARNLEINPTSSGVGEPSLMPVSLAGRRPP
jgi:hypothetical protein